MKPLLSDFLKARRYRAIRPYVRGAVLDLGCGRADVLDALPQVREYVGVEGHPGIYRWLLENRPAREFHLVDLEREALPLDRKFDTILMLAILEHLKDPGRLLEQFPSLLNPGGRALITTPSPLGDAVHRLGARLGLFYRSAVDEHQAIHSRPELVDLLEGHSLKVLAYRRFLLGGNQLVICEAARGAIR